MFVPALIGGVLAGILSGIPFIECLCCLWIIGGGMLAAYFLTKESSVVLKAGDGAIVGIFTGIIASITSFLVSIPLRPWEEKVTSQMMEWLSAYTDEMPAGWESFFEEGAMEASSMAWTILSFVVSAVIFSALGALGGIIGISLFAKKKVVHKTEGVVDVSEDTSDRQS
jgi:hypothetical protein